MVNEANIDRHNCVDFNFFRNQIKKEGSVNTVDPNFSSAVNVRYFFPKRLFFVVMIMVMAVWFGALFSSSSSSSLSISTGKGEPNFQTERKCLAKHLN